MGTPATPEALVARWGEVLRDPALRDLPYKIELNAWGKVEMAPRSNRRGRLAGEISAALVEQLQGSVFISCAILTASGIRTPDVAWASPEFMQAFGEMTPYVQAPEICVEIFSEATLAAEIEEKTAAYFAAGAQEVWLVSEEASVRYAAPSGDMPKSRFPVSLSLPARIR